jgi:hypothetical protein
MLIFYELNDNKDGWEEVGRIKDNQVISEGVEGFERWMRDQKHLPEEMLARRYNNHYVNAVLVEEENE